MRPVLIQLAVSGFEPLLEWSERRHREYAEFHGMDYEAHYRVPVEAEGRHPVWSKIALILRSLDRGRPAVYWLDADALVARLEVPLTAAVPAESGFWLGMVANVGGVTGADPWHLNAGALYVNRTPEAIRFFEQVWDGPDDDPWQEQAVMNRLLEEQDYDGLLLLRPHWNSTEGVNPVRNPIVRAWHGLGNPAERLSKMQGAVL